MNDMKEGLGSAMDAVARRLEALRAERDVYRDRAERAELRVQGLQAEVTRLEGALEAVRGRAKLLILALIRRLAATRATDEVSRNAPSEVSEA